MVDISRRTLLAGGSTAALLSLVRSSASAETTEESGGSHPESDREHVASLLDRLTLAEKLSLLHQYQPPIPRLDLDAFRTGTEALHGVSWLGEATVFPQPIGLGSTWDPDLVKRVGSAVGDEVRRRHEEGYAEDPLLSGRLASAYASGLSGEDPYYLKTAPVLKHFIGYNNETDRTTTNAEIPPQLLHDYYLPFFRTPIESGNAVGVMASYNLLNGRPMTVSPLLDAVREWAPGPVMNVSDA